MQDVIPGVSVQNICELHAASKLVKPQTISPKDGKEVIVKKPVFKFDLEGTDDDVTDFWALCSTLSDVGTAGLSSLPTRFVMANSAYPRI